MRTTHEEDGDPGEADVVERDGALERVLLAGPAVRVVLVPVDARAVDGQAVRPDGQARHDAVVAVAALVLGRRQRRARVHAVVLGQRADVVLLRLLHLVVAGQRPNQIQSFNHFVSI